MNAFRSLVAIIFAMTACFSRTATANNQPHDDTMRKKAGEAIVLEVAGVKFSETDIDRFWSKVNKNGPLPDQSNPHYAGLDQCWIWVGTLLQKRDYGRFSLQRKSIYAHRISFVLAHNEFPLKGQACHRCDNRRCVNPSHLFDGSHEDNTNDRDRKGRTASGDKCGLRLHPEARMFGDDNGSRKYPERLKRGEQSPVSKLTDDMVREIRMRFSDGEHGTAIAKDMGICSSSAYYIRDRVTWKHVI